MLAYRVLIPLDGSDFSRQILSRVQSFFDPEESELILLRVSPLPEGLTAPPPRPVVIDTVVVSEYRSSRHLELAQHPIERNHVLANVAGALQDELHAAALPLEQAGYPVVTLVRFGQPATEIVRAAEEEGVDLVAMATHGRSGIGRLVLGSVAEEVLRHMTLPLLLVRPVEEAARELNAGTAFARRLASGEPLRLAVATDGSPHSLRATEAAFGLANQLRARVTLVAAASDDGEATRARDALQMVRLRAGDAGEPPEIVPLVGFNYRRLLDRLEGAPIDLLVAGSFADRSAAPPFSVGLTVRQLVQFARVPVLIVKGESSSFRRILACTAVGDDLIVEVAARLAKMLDAELRLLHVVTLSEDERLGTEAGVEIPPAAILSRQTGQAHYLRTCLSRLEALGFDERTLMVRCGLVPETIVQAAREENHDLIVVGKGARSEFFLGSIADRVVRQAPRSVLVV